MNLSNENRLLLYCAQVEIPQDILNEVKHLTNSPLNWEEVLEAASWHGITSLLYHNLKNIRKIPREIMNHLKNAYFGNIVRNLYLYSELNRILDKFYKNDIEVIVLKGAALAKTVYRDIGLRPMADIDLMVRRENLPLIWKLMHELNYGLMGNKPPEWYIENHHHLRYKHMEKPILIEIHWHIADKSHPSRIRITDTTIIESWWKRSKLLEFEGKKTLILCPEDLLLHLSLHFLKHRFIKGRFTSKSALIQLCDIYQTLKHYGDKLDWTGLRSEAEKYKVYELINLTLCIVRDFWGDNKGIFGYALKDFSLSSSNYRKQLELIKSKILLREDPLFDGFIPLLKADTFQKKLKVIIRKIFPRSHVLSKKYTVSRSSKKLYLYYFIHPFKLSLKYGKLILRISNTKKWTREEVTLNKWINPRG